MIYTSRQRRDAAAGDLRQRRPRPRGRHARRHGGYSPRARRCASSAAQATGAADYWYAKRLRRSRRSRTPTARPSPFRPTARRPIAIVLRLHQGVQADAKPTATGNPPATLTAVMTDQVDIGWASPPFGLKEIEEGKIHLVAAATDATDRARADHSRHRRQCRRAEEAQGRDRALHAGLSRDHRLHVFGQSAGDEGLCRIRSESPEPMAKRVRDEFFPKSLLRSD